MVEESGSGEPETTYSHAENVLNHRLDWNILRKLSLSPGGFGPKRVDLW
jgi:hypothetical protein